MNITKSPTGHRALFEKHGTQGYYNKGCRCERCKLAKREYRTQTAVLGHGTKWYYDKGCRCDSCVDAKQEYRRKTHPQKHRKLTTDIIEGTRICYSCKETKRLDEFGRNKNNRVFLGRSHECRGCHNERGRRNKVEPQARYRTYKYGAKYRKIGFNLSYDEFMSFWNLPCYLCGKEIEGIGLDRKDSGSSYVLGNVEPCCAMCNKSKGPRTYDEFIKMCQLVSKKFEERTVLR